MIRINQIKVTPKEFHELGAQCLKQKIRKILRIEETQIIDLQIRKQSIDARKKPEIFLSFVVDVKVKEEGQLLKHCKDKNVSSAPSMEYHFPKSGTEILHHPPVIIGAGPAGLFCALELALHGYKPLVLERGEAVEKRFETVEHFFKTNELNVHSNVQFGEGGAGTFSDGKLNTLVKDPAYRNREVLQRFVEAGAPDKILYENKPHLGTDLLVGIVRALREEIVSRGGTVQFSKEVTDFSIENGMLTGLVVNHTEKIPCDTVVLAIGHSARNTLETLYERKVSMEAKAFAVGLRIEHSQAFINKAQYGCEEPLYLEPAPYKVAAKTSLGRGVYSFCMCPGGYVVNASSEENRLSVNGMSYSRRDSINANSAIIVSVTPDDYKSGHPLAGVSFQRMLEERAYAEGNGKIPVQYLIDFKENRPSVEKKEGKAYEGISPLTKGPYRFANVRNILPEELNLALLEGLEYFGKQIHGFDGDEALLSGVESRTSSPVRIHRDSTFQSNILGLYPCGEGAGYAGGITSAAMDGIKVAEEIAKRYAPVIL